MRGSFLHLGSVYLQACAGSGNPRYGSPYPHSCCQGNGLTDENRKARRNRYSYLTRSTHDGYAQGGRCTPGGYANTARSAADGYANAAHPTLNRCSHAIKSACNRYTGSTNTHVNTSATRYTSPYSHVHTSSPKTSDHELAGIRHAGLPLVASGGSRS